jgi:hypothetical protein
MEARLPLARRTELACRRTALTAPRQLNFVLDDVRFRTMTRAERPDRLLDHIELCDTLKRLARDRRAAILGDVEELAAQMRPAEGERNGLDPVGIVDDAVEDSSATAR